MSLHYNDYGKYEKDDDGWFRVLGAGDGYSSQILFSGELEDLEKALISGELMFCSSANAILHDEYGWYDEWPEDILKLSAVQDAIEWTEFEFEVDAILQNEFIITELSQMAFDNGVSFDINGDDDRGDITAVFGIKTTDAKDYKFSIDISNTNELSEVVAKMQEVSDNFTPTLYAKSQLGMHNSPFVTLDRNDERVCKLLEEGKAVDDKLKDFVKYANERVQEIEQELEREKSRDVGLDK